MTPTPLPQISDFSSFGSGIVTAWTGEPVLIILLVAALVVGLAFRMSRGAKKVAAK